MRRGVLVTRSQEKMKAWRFYGFNDLRLDEVPRPRPEPHHVLARIRVVQPSVTEVQLARGVQTLAYEKIKRRLEQEAPVQLFGHEFCAEVVELGEGVSRVEVGDRVAARAKLPCGRCGLCEQGRDADCREGPIIGFDLPGCFSEYQTLSEKALVRVPKEVSDNEAACLQPLSDVVAAVETAGIRLGESVAIFGQGSMGLDILQVVRASGAGLIVAIDVRDEALAVSRQLGADILINAQKEDPAKVVKQITAGIGMDVVFESAGGSPKAGLAGFRTVEQAIDCVRPGGKVMGISWFGEKTRVDLDLLRERSLRYLFPDISTYAHLEHAVRLVVSRRVTVEPVLTHILEGIEQVPQAFEIAANKAKYRAINPAQVVMTAE